MCERCWTMDDNKVRRPVRLADFMVVGANFLYNIAQVLETATGELLELSMYHANRKTEEAKAWESFSQDLETLKEDTDGA